MSAGKLIVIEGLDGSGKATQTQKLSDSFGKAGIKAKQITFPDYESDSSVLVKMYLDGQIGPLGDVNPYAASTFYAADRYISYSCKWKEAYLSGYTILSDRYTTSNIAHQMTKLCKPEWDDYIAWLEDYEYNRLGLPRPHVVVYLDMHPDTSRELIKKRYAKSGGAMDIHERDLSYLLACREAALYAATQLKWHVIACCDGKSPRNADDIAGEILAITQTDERD